MVGGLRRPVDTRFQSAGAGAARSPSTATAFGGRPPSTASAASAFRSPSTAVAVGFRSPSIGQDAAALRSPSTCQDVVAAALRPPFTGAAGATARSSTGAAAVGRSPSIAGGASFRSSSLGCGLSSSIPQGGSLADADHRGSPSTLRDMRQRNQAKWIAYNNKPTKGKEVDNGKAVEDIFEDVELPRPKGQKAAKRDAHEAKGKSKESAIDIDLHKFEQIQNDFHTKRMKVLEIQQKLSAEKVESAKINLLTAKDKKDANLYEKQTKMLETYRCLLTQDMSGMTDDIRAEHVAALKCLRMKLFPELQ